MAYSIVWPPTLPQVPLKPYGESGGVRVLRTPMDKGPSKVRFLSAKPDVIPLEFLMTTAQLSTFITFAKETTRGVLRFGLPHPRTKQTEEARFLTGGEGDLYSVDNAAPGVWRVRFQVEILP